MCAEESKVTGDREAYFEDGNGGFWRGGLNESDLGARKYVAPLGSMPFNSTPDVSDVRE